MRKLAIAFVVLGMALAAVPAFAVMPSAPVPTDEVYTGLPGAGGGVRSTNDCPGPIVWDAGMFDEFVPPVGSASATASVCFVNAIDVNEFCVPPCDTRIIADEWEVAVPTTITGLKLWSRYSACGNDYHINTPGSLHGFCVKIWEQDYATLLCPDGSIAGQDAIGPLVYDQYVDTFSEHMITTGTLLRNWNYCINLPAAPAFVAQPGKVYYMSASADFDFVGWAVPPDTVGAATQFYVRMFTDPSPADDYTPYCMGSVYSDGAMFTATNWIDIDTNSPTAIWPGWNVGYVVYGTPEAPPAEGACCDALGACTVTVEAACAGTWTGGITCTPNPCPPVPTENKSWGQIKNSYK